MKLTPDLKTAAPPPTLWRGGLDFWTQQNLEELKFFKIKRGGGGGGGGGGRESGKKNFEIFIGGKIAGDETSNRKHNFRINLKMFSWII